MRYLRVRWIHSCPDEPVEIFSEIDEAGWEVRKVELFSDGSLGFAPSANGVCSTRLGEKPMPSDEEIATDPQFIPIAIGKDEFERYWYQQFAGSDQSVASL